LKGLQPSHRPPITAQACSRSHAEARYGLAGSCPSTG
jgi:hypothetical protein